MPARLGRRPVCRAGFASRELRRAGSVVVLLGATAVLSASVANAANLIVRGTHLAERQVNALMSDALRAPGDSTRLVPGLARLVARLQDAGYLDARAGGTWDGSRLRVEVREGQQLRFTRVAVRAYSRGDSVRWARALALRVGEAASPSRVAAAMVRHVTAVARELTRSR